MNIEPQRIVMRKFFSTSDCVISMALIAVFSFISHNAQADDNIARCAQEKVTFDGIEPLKYADVIGDAGSHIALNRQHPGSCKSTSADDCAGKAYLVPGNTVAVANTCGDYSHVQYIGEKKVSVGWIESDRLKERVVSNLNDHVMQSSQDSKMSRLAYQFKLTKGHNTPVCEAYLQRLNFAGYQHDEDEPPFRPFCDRPENDVVAGFTKLNRIPMTLEDRNRLIFDVYNFTHPDSKVAAIRAEAMFSPFAAKISAPIWRYDPPVDIDNDGVPDNVVVWQGWGAEAGTGVCGSSYTSTGGLALRSVQQAYILTADDASVDEGRTTAVFWHRKQVSTGIEPIGQSISIFKYQDKYYFDAFFYGPKSFDQRRSDSKLANTLGVFFHKVGSTRQICEYHMSDPELASEPDR